MAVTYRISSQENIVYLTVAGSATGREMGGAMWSDFADPEYRPGFDFLSDWRLETNCPDVACVRSAHKDVSTTMIYTHVLKKGAMPSGAPPTCETGRAIQPWLARLPIARNVEDDLM